jgi:hypothetical protein
MMLTRVERTAGNDVWSKRSMTYGLWTAQALLALLFLFTGGTKLFLPYAGLAKQMPIVLPKLFVRFLGLAEVLGAVGLILPGLLRIQMVLTPLAAAGLTMIMVGATIYTLVGGLGPTALMPAIVGILVAFVAFGRWRRLDAA